MCVCVCVRATADVGLCQGWQGPERVDSYHQSLNRNKKHFYHTHIDTHMHMYTHITLGGISVLTLPWKGVALAGHDDDRKCEASLVQLLKVNFYSNQLCVNMMLRLENSL